MAKVRCEYCGYYIDDSQEVCPTCGAANKDHKRSVGETPQTIAELQSWYRARNLPPEEVTRFFIGKDTHAPRAFGIYEADGVFVVYKNKADGSRAIRYKGSDEAYAVNELYMRLKEEILNQKNLNLKKQSRNQNNLYNRSPSRKPRSNKTGVITTIIAVIIVMNIAIIGMFSLVTQNLNYSSSYDYYLTETNQIYYNEGYEYQSGGYNWWIYDISLGEWEFFQTYEDEETLPPGLESAKRYEYATDLASHLGMEYHELDIYRSKAYIDAGHHMTPSTSYYYHDDNLYYFLDDSHASYGSGDDNSGWYIYRDDSWEYYCSENDKEILGDDLWYNDGEYYAGRDIGDIYYYTDSLSSTWNPTDFEDTTWYQSYESNEAAYDRYWEDQQSSYDDDDYDWSSDSDWDWDSGSDWDSGGTDWDSDW